MIRRNSFESYRKCLEDENYHTIIGKVFRTFIAEGRPLTDREVCKLNGEADMNWARPKITKLIAEGILQEVGTVHDDQTDRTVRKCAVVPAGSRL